MEASRERRTTVFAAGLTALVAFLPFLRGAFLRHAFFFRDLSRHFFPHRRFVLDALASGHIPYWNPLLHEGEPLGLPAISYPLDLLQLLWRDEAGLSLLLALHVPLGAAALFWLARELGLSRTAAVGGGIIYALGGFYLSTLNLYVYVEAAAWAPVVL